LDSRLQIKEQAVQYRNGFLEKSYKKSEILKVRNEVIRERNGSNTNNFGKNGK
jgi:hypothetical protein